MKLFRLALGAFVLLFAIGDELSSAQSAPGVAGAPDEIPTIHATSSLVYLDVTVLDKNGNPVVKGLTRDDFTITEGNKPQRIFSFEAPDIHVIAKKGDSLNADGTAPVTIFVLDLINCSFEDAAFLRYSVHNYLDGQPKQLTSPAELMVVGNNSMQLLQGYTRSKADLLYALEHLPGVLPYKQMNPSFFGERFAQSVEALQQIAMQSQGVPGRKNVIWLGFGAPGINTQFLPPTVAGKLAQFVHVTTNMLVDARITLFVIYPGLSVSGGNMSLSAFSADANLGNNDPFAGDINFGIFVNETGGKLAFNRNDVDVQMERSQHLGSEYFTLTYQPAQGEEDGKFRRIRVALRDPKLHALTKAGYYAPDSKTTPDPRGMLIASLAAASRAAIPFTGLDVRIFDVVRHPDSRTVAIMAEVKDKGLDWEPTDDGRLQANLVVGIVSLSETRQALASRLEHMRFTVPSADPAKRGSLTLQVPVTVGMPRETRSVRVTIANEEGGRLGSAELNRKTIEAAPAKPTPEPALAPKPAQKTPVPGS